MWGVERACHTGQHRSLQSVCVTQEIPRDLASRRLVRAIPGSLSDERAVHRALEDFRVDGEWYLAEKLVRDFISAVQPGEYPRVDRPGGRLELPDVTTPEEQAQLKRALDGLFS